MACGGESAGGAPGGEEEAPEEKGSGGEDEEPGEEAESDGGSGGGDSLAQEEQEDVAGVCAQSAAEADFRAAFAGEGQEACVEDESGEEGDNAGEGVEEEAEAAEGCGDVGAAAVVVDQFETEGGDIGVEEAGSDFGGGAADAPIAWGGEGGGAPGEEAVGIVGPVEEAGNAEGEAVDVEEVAGEEVVAGGGLGGDPGEGVAVVEEVGGGVPEGGRAVDPEGSTIGEEAFVFAGREEGSGAGEVGRGGG